MKLINLTKLTTSNLLSLLGYPGILCFLYIRFIFFPIDWADLEGYHYDRDMLGFVSSATSALYFMLACLICAVFFVLILIEFFIRKKNKTEFQLINKIPEDIKAVLMPSLEDINDQLTQAKSDHQHGRIDNEALNNMKNRYVDEINVIRGILFSIDSIIILEEMDNNPNADN